jgi:hypothetical protein
MITRSLMMRQLVKQFHTESLTYSFSRATVPAIRTLLVTWARLPYSVPSLTDNVHPQTDIPVSPNSYLPPIFNLVFNVLNHSFMLSNYYEYIYLCVVTPGPQGLRLFIRCLSASCGWFYWPGHVSVFMLFHLLFHMYLCMYRSCSHFVRFVYCPV